MIFFCFPDILKNKTAETVFQTELYMINSFRTNLFISIDISGYKLIDIYI